MEDTEIAQSARAARRLCVVEGLNLMIDKLAESGGVAHIDADALRTA